MNTVNRLFRGMLVAGVATGCLALQAAEPQADLSKLPAASSRTGLAFDKDIKPLLEAACAKCHGGDKPKGHYSVETREAAIKGGEAGATVKPGKSTESTLLLFAADAVKDMEMPPLKKRQQVPPLTKDQLALVRAWIDQGAK